MPKKAWVMTALAQPVVREDGSSRSLSDEVAAVAKALGHPARIHIIQLLLARRSCIGCDIVDEVGLAQSTISEHLRILKSAGVIVGEIERPRVCYSLNPDAVAPLARLLNAILGMDNEDTRRASR